ncbi:DNA polymerase delta subunit 3 [Hyposmocoma kahamanoa]|uniref:DNA polymerase delta subunit 3 n=1 Tax=Hyposmocoma kahamanoa TaxID=1477025 RepID=UPI000E6D67A5|nr:DNA polymerase delta subunit 3 [Hyposmocoma kahamanoa]
MDEDTLQANMATLKEMILDEERLVTYVSLSKDLCIHVNDSKLLLNKLVEDIRQKGPVDTINVSYIISGITEDCKGRTTVAAEQNIAEARNTFKTIFFEHVYSISKGLSNIDKVAFLAVCKFEDFPLCTGLIKSSSCVKRSSDEINTFKSNSQATELVEPKPSSSLQKKIKIEPKEIAKNGHTEPKEVTKVHETKSEPTIKSEISSPKKHQTSNGKPKQELKKNGHKSQKSIAGFFNKSNSAPTKTVEVIKSKNDIKELKAEKQNCKKNPVMGAEQMEIDEEVENKQKETESKKETQNKERQQKEISSNKSLNQIKRNAKVDTKRKRVLYISDSESDCENNPFVDDVEPNIEHVSEDEIPPTPAVKTLKISSGITNPKKRRKIVDKTYTDEDGYILTKKEEVYESCSDNEEKLPSKENIVQGNQVKVPPKIELSPKKNGPKNSKKPSQKGKQATLTNFFKKV